MKEWLFKKRFLGWTNIKWFIKELVYMGSGSKKSFFSIKRFQVMSAFVIYQHGALWYIHKKIESMDATDFLMWASSELLICGYTLNHVQKEKKDEAAA